MDLRYWDNMYTNKYQYKTQGSESSGDMGRGYGCYYHGSRDMLSEDPRERSGPYSSNSSSERREDKEMLAEELDVVTPIKQRMEPYLEMRQKGMTGSMESTLNKNMYQSYNGQLKLAVYKNCGLLTVHVIQARHLSSPQGAPSCAYVRVSVVPDNQKRTKCKTKIVSDTDYPTFDDKFSFEILEEDARKRLLVSVWNKQSDGRSAFLGCTSFGIRHLDNKHKNIDGWYFLLSEELGRHKHLRVSTSDAQVSEPRQTKPTRRTNSSSTLPKPCMYTSTPRTKVSRDMMATSHRTADETAPSMLSLNMLQTSYIDDTADPSQLRMSMLKSVSNPQDPSQLTMSMLKSVSKPQDLDVILGKKVPGKIIIQRGPDGGFGFSVTGTAPVIVSSVQPNGPAVEAGLREEDVIERLNGQDVQFSSAEMVAATIRHSSNCIIMEVRRKTKPWTVWRPPTLSEIPEYISSRCASPTSLSCDLISGICSFGKQKKKAQKS